MEEQKVKTGAIQRLLVDLEGDRPNNMPHDYDMGWTNALDALYERLLHLVEAGGFEPPTPCLQSRCNDETPGSANLTDRTEAHDGAQPKDAEETQGHERPWTPGPWELDGYNIYAESWKGPKNEQGCLSCGCHTEDRSTWDVVANQRLSAAAPELFEALQTLLGYVDSPCGGCGESFAPQSIFAQARAALAKALGEDRG